MLALAAARVLLVLGVAAGQLRLARRRVDRRRGPYGFVAGLPRRGHEGAHDDAGEEEDGAAHG